MRLLRTLSGQIRSRVDNFDRAIDHALASFKTLPSFKSETSEPDELVSARMMMPAKTGVEEPKPGSGADSSIRIVARAWSAGTEW